MHFSRTPIAVAIALSLTVALALSACSGSSTSAKSPHAGTITWVRPLPIDGWQGDKCIISSTPVNGILYDSLTHVKSPTGDGVSAGLASSWKSDPAADTWTLTIRKNAKFSNGKRVTAADVAWSIDQWRAGSVSGAIYAPITGVKADGTSTVVISTATNNSIIPEMLTWCTSTVYPKNYGGKTAAQFFKAPIGAGPYALASTTNSGTASETITLKPNKYYWGSRSSTVKNIVIKAVANANQRALLFKAKKVDIIEDVDAPLAKQLPATDIKRPSPQALQALTITAKAVPDPDIRKAISLALDRKSIAATYGVGAVAATTPLSSNIPGTTDPTTPYTYNVSAAKALMAKSTHPGGIRLSMTYDSDNYAYGLIAQAVQSQLSKIGVTVSLQAVDGTTWTTDIGSGNYQLSVQPLGALSPSIFDPIIALTQYIYPGTGFTNDDLIKLQNQGISATTSEGASTAVKALEDQVMTTNTWIGLVNYSENWAVQPWVGGFTPLQYGLFPYNTLTSK